MKWKVPCISSESKWGFGDLLPWWYQELSHGSHLLLLCVSPSEGNGAFPGSEIYRMVEQINGQLKESTAKVLEEER